MNTPVQEMPETLMEAVTYFSNSTNAHDFMVQLRWADGVKCPRCQSDKVCAIPTRKTWECKCCTEKKQFSVKTGTIFEESPLPLAKWLATIWLIANAKNGISSYEVHRAIGVTQKTAWFMLHRVRAAMKTGTFEKLAGVIETDETFIGGKAINMHASRRRTLPNKGVGGQGKVAVHGMLERGDGGASRVQVSVVPNTQKATIKPILDKSVEIGSTLYSDTAMQYLKLDSDLLHEMVDHAIEYVRGKVHTNGMENFWSLLKRSLKGTYVSVDPVHLFRYLDEQVFRFNERKLNDAMRFFHVASEVVGKRLTYAQLTDKTAHA
jgi:transposase-like protein